MYDVIIIGAGPAGISAGIYAVSRGLKTLILERDEVGGLIGKVSTVTHYAGVVEEETGASFSKRLRDQAERSGIDIVYSAVTEVELLGAIKRVHTEETTYETQRLILATGTSPRRLGIPGEVELAGKGMCMNAARDAQRYTGRHIYVVGGADGAVKEALYLARFGSQVTIIHFEDQLGCIAEFRRRVEKTPNIRLLLHTRLHAVHGQDEVSSLQLRDEHTGHLQTIEDPGCGIFVYAGTQPNTSLFSILTLEDGFIPTDHRMQTGIPGVFAVGDIRSKDVRQVSTAVADGTIAAIHAAMIS